MSTVGDQHSSAADRFRRWISLDTPSGALLLIAAVVAVIWANSPWEAAYHSLAEFEFGPESLHLHLSLEEWAADGLLAIFFFVVGVELKQEFVMGSLRQPKQAGVPIAAALGGMVVPALFYVVIVGVGDPDALNGWAIPTATDIAFALAVLAIFGRGLPLALRTFLLTLAVVDDLLGITIIATFYTETIDFLMLVIALALIVVFAFLVRMRKTHWWVLIPVAVAAWGFMHASGVHSTVAGVLLGFVVPAKYVHGEKESRTHRFDDAVRPVSSAVALPIFAFLAAGVTVVGTDAELIQPVSIGIFLGLVVGKLIGAMGVTALMTRFTPLRLPDSIGVRDLLPVGFLTGIGFTVALLIDELSFVDTDPHAEASKTAILVGSLVAATLAALWLRWDARQTRAADMNRDNVPDRNIDVIGG